MILLSTITSLWGALPHAATADICDTVKKVVLEIGGIKNLSLWFKRSKSLQYVIYRPCTLGLTSEMPLMEYGHPGTSCSRAPISTSELLLMEHGHLELLVLEVITVAKNIENTARRFLTSQNTVCWRKGGRVGGCLSYCP